MNGIFYVVNQDLWPDFRNALVSEAQAYAPSGCRAGNLAFTRSLLPIFQAFWEKNGRGGMKAVVLQGGLADVAEYLRQTYPCVPVIEIEITMQKIEQIGGRGYIAEIRKRLAATTGGRVIAKRKVQPEISRLQDEYEFVEDECGGLVALSSLP